VCVVGGGVERHKPGAVSAGRGRVVERGGARKWPRVQKVRVKMKFEECLSTLGVKTPPNEIDFVAVRKAYLKAALASHPDKHGGDEYAFLKVQSAFEAIKKATNNGAISLSTFAGKDLDAAVSVAPRRSAAYYEAAAQALPSYKVERAKTSRGKCAADGTPIAEGEVKVGSMVPELGDYGRWTKLTNWKVPSAIQACLSLGDGLGGDSISIHSLSFVSSLLCGETKKSK
jgi:hypothetical protein